MTTSILNAVTEAELLIATFRQAGDDGLFGIARQVDCSALSQ
jgi:hypothetical protein